MGIARQHWLLVQMPPEPAWCDGRVAVFLLELESRTCLRSRSWTLGYYGEGCPWGGQQNRVSALEERISPKGWVCSLIYAAALEFPWSWAGSRTALHVGISPTAVQAALNLLPCLPHSGLWHSCDPSTARSRSWTCRKHKAEVSSFQLVWFSEQACCRAGWA